MTTTMTTTMTTGTMSTGTIGSGRTDRTASTWVCPNCRHETGVERKRCRDCGTSRY